MYIFCLGNAHVGERVIVFSFRRKYGEVLVYDALDMDEMDVVSGQSDLVPSRGWRR